MLPPLKMGYYIIFPYCIAYSLFVYKFSKLVKSSIYLHDYDNTKYLTALIFSIFTILEIVLNVNNPIFKLVKKA